MFATVEAHDLMAVLGAYTFSTVSVRKEEWGEIARRQGVDVAALMRGLGGQHGLPALPAQAAHRDNIPTAL